MLQVSYDIVELGRGGQSAHYGELNMLVSDGMKFGRLTVIRRARGSNGWMCECDCGKISFVLSGNLTSGNSKSCGCARGGGIVHLPEYGVWRGMRSRCYQKNDPAYRNYGGRGITVCGEWGDFVQFLKDVGPRPFPKAQLDRIDNSLGYFKENCQWTTATANLNNRRSNRRIEFGGKTQTIAEWASELGIAYRTLNNRLNRGWSIEDALSEPVASKGLN